MPPIHATLVSFVILAGAPPHRASAPGASPHPPADMDLPPPAPSARGSSHAPREQLRALVRAAWRRAGLHLESRARWSRRARAAAALPTLTLGYDRRTDQGWDRRHRVDQPDVLDTDAGATHTFHARATWNLDRAIYSDDEQRIAQTYLDLEARRAALRREVTTLFEERLSLRARWNALAPDSVERVTIAARIEALSRALTLLCGPEF